MKVTNPCVLFNLNTVWRPTLFVFTYSMMQIPNTAMKNFLVKGLHFSDFELGIYIYMHYKIFISLSCLIKSFIWFQYLIGLLLIGAAIFGWLGLVIYREFLFETSWRTLYVRVFPSIKNRI